MHVSEVIRDSSIRARLSVLIVLNSSLALLLAGFALFGYETYQQRQEVTRELSAKAGILAASSTAALSFNDQRAAGETLASLRGDSNVVECILYDRNDHIFSRYLREGASAGVSRGAPRPGGAYFEGGALLVYQPILVGAERVGTILLRSTNDVYARIWRFTGIVSLVMLLSLGLALLLGFGTQRSIADPIKALSVLARGVSVDRDYSVRANRTTGGEIGILIDSFNDMLSQIEARETARREAEESLRESEERYALAARGANDGLWDWKLTTDLIYFSSRWNQMLGYCESEIWTKPEEWFGRIHPMDRARVVAETAALREGSKSELASEYRMSHKNGTFIWVLTRGISIRDSKGTVVRMAGSQTDITEGKVADPLTALPNRLYFIDRLDSAVEACREHGSVFAVLFLDLDKFKVVNDSLGHEAGDQLLAGVAMRLRISVISPPSEILHPNPVIARLGGDEFAVLLEGRDGTEAELVATRVLEALKVPFTLDGRQMFASASIGIALSSTGKSPEDLMRNADTAMYQAKGKGKSRFEVFDEAMRERAVARLEIETDLRKAIEGNQLVVHYQPEVSLSSQQIIGYEALVRWNHPVRGLLGPNEFIPIAEESDLILQLGCWVLKAACFQMAQWHTNFPSDVPPTISVNVSPKQLSNPRLVEDIEGVLAESGLNPGYLNLEMTESSIMSNADTTLDTLRRLKQMKIGLEIDDFGTGYSSLSCLHLLPFDTVKIDRSFIKELGTAREGAEIVHTIVELARSLQMKVVAEGVETKDQIHTLTALGCTYAQGYYFSKPKSAEQTEELMIERKQIQQAFGMLRAAPKEKKTATRYLAPVAMGE